MTEDIGTVNAKWETLERSALKFQAIIGLEERSENRKPIDQGELLRNGSWTVPWEGTEKRRWNVWHRYKIVCELDIKTRMHKTGDNEATYREHNGSLVWEY